MTPPDGVGAGGCPIAVVPGGAVAVGLLDPTTGDLVTAIAVDSGIDPVKVHG